MASSASSAPADPPAAAGPAALVAVSEASAAEQDGAQLAPLEARWTDLGPILESQTADTLEDALGTLSGEIKKETDEDRAIFKQVRKEVKELSALLKGLPDLEARMAMLSKKHIHLLISLRQTERPQAAMRQRIALVKKERDAALKGLEEAKAARAVVEKTCRELQLQNRNALGEGKRVAAEQQQKRKELSQQFQSAIQDVVAKIDSDGQARLKAAADADELRNKFKEHLSEYEQREQQVGIIVAQKDVETERAQARVTAQQQTLLKVEQEFEAQQERHASILETERDLRRQLASYAEKFEHFQSTLAASNEMFTSFKTEMDKTTKTIKALEKENASLKSRWEKGTHGLAEMSDEREAQAQVLKAVEGKVEKLEELCRLLQGQRTDLLAEIRVLEERVAQSQSTESAPQAAQ